MNIGTVIKLAVGNAIVFFTLFLVTLPFWAKPLLRVLGAVLGAMSEFGAGRY